MRRRVVETSTGTSIISLPHDWIKNNEINKGDELEIENHDNNLIIKSNKITPLEAEIDLTDLDWNLIWRYLISLYRKGVDKVVVNNCNLEKRKIIQRFIHALNGWAITKHEEDKIIIKDLALVENSKIDDILKKIITLLTDMANNTLEAIQSSEMIVLRNMPQTDYSVNKFTNLCLRVLNKQGYISYKKTSSMYKIISVLEEIGDEYRKLSMICMKHNIKINKNTLEVFKKVNNLLELYRDIFYSFDKHKIKKFYDSSNLITNNLKNKFKNKTMQEIIVLSSLDSILHLTKSLAEETLQINL